MPWPLIVELIIEIGLPATEALIKKWNSGADATPADFVELRTLASQTAKDRLVAILAKSGIALDSPQAIELMKHVGQ